MKLLSIATGALAFSLLAVTPVSSTAQGGAQLGNISASGAVLVDGQPASGSVAVANVARIATGDGGNAVLTLASGGEVRLDGPGDVVVTQSGNGVRVQLVCGKATVTSTGPAMVYAAKGGRATAMTGSVDVTADGGKVYTLKVGKKGASRDDNGEFMVNVTGGSSVMLESTIQCNCHCS